VSVRKNITLQITIFRVNLLSAGDNLSSLCKIQNVVLLGRKGFVGEKNLEFLTRHQALASNCQQINFFLTNSYCIVLHICQ